MVARCQRDTTVTPDDTSVAPDDTTITPDDTSVRTLQGHDDSTPGVQVRRQHSRGSGQVSPVTCPGRVTPPPPVSIESKHLSNRTGSLFAAVRCYTLHSPSFKVLPTQKVRLLLSSLRCMQNQDPCLLLSSLRCMQNQDPFVDDVGDHLELRSPCAKA